MKKRIITFVLIVISIFIVHADDENNEFDFEGTWATNIVAKDSLVNSTFLAITKMQDGEHYLVISVNPENPIFTFVASGVISGNGMLYVETTDGWIWTYAEGHSSQYNDVIDISNQENIESFEVYYRIDKKLTNWN